MRGHEQILTMRRQGMRPGIVFLNDYPCATDWAQHGDHATVCVHGDQPEWLDLRYLIGLRVSVSATSEARARRFMAACRKAGAVTVGAGAPGYSEIWHKEAVHG